MPRWILVVDDEPDLELLISQRFRQRIRSGELGFAFAGDGAAALEMLRSRPEIELVLTDIKMPVMDGLTLLRKLLELDCSARKTVILSAYGDMPNIRAAMNLGAFDFLNKPFDLTDLERTLDRALRQAERDRQLREEEERLAALEGDVAAAARIQQALLPSVCPAFPERTDLDVYAEMIPARLVGGDFYDFYFIAPDRLAFAIGDVSGKGIPAAMYMSVCRMLIKASAKVGRPPADILRVVNATLVTELNSSTFITACVGILDLSNGQLEYALAGHNAPAWIKPGGEVSFLEEPGGLLLGKFDDAAYVSEKVRLAPGDTILLFTDGITEAVDTGGRFLDDTLSIAGELAPLAGAPVRELVRSFLRRVETFTAGAPQYDDQTILAIRFKP